MACSRHTHVLLLPTNASEDSGFHKNQKSSTPFKTGNLKQIWFHDFLKSHQKRHIWTFTNLLTIGLKRGYWESMAKKHFHAFMLIGFCVKIWSNMKDLTVCTRVIDFWMSPHLLCRGHMVPLFSWRTKEVVSLQALGVSQTEINRQCFLKYGTGIYHYANYHLGVKSE